MDSHPHQPKKFSYTLRSFGSKGEELCFQPVWFDKWSWLEYREATDSVVCFYCSHAKEREILEIDLFVKIAKSPIVVSLLFGHAH